MRKKKKQSLITQNGNVMRIPQKEKEKENGMKWNENLISFAFGRRFENFSFLISAQRKIFCFFLSHFSFAFLKIRSV